MTCLLALNLIGLKQSWCVMLMDMQDSNWKAELQLENQIKDSIFRKNSNTMFILNIGTCIDRVALNLSQFSLLKGFKCLNTNFGLGCNSDRSNSESLDRAINCHNLQDGHMLCLPCTQF